MRIGAAFGVGVIVTVLLSGGACSSDEDSSDSPRAGTSPPPATRCSTRARRPTTKSHGLASPTPQWSLLALFDISASPSFEFAQTLSHAPSGSPVYFRGAAKVGSKYVVWGDLITAVAVTFGNDALIYDSAANNSTFIAELTP